jgi:PAS domain-containing protein
VACRFHSDGSAYEATDWPLARSLMTGEVVRGEDTIFERKDGTRGTVRIWCAPTRNTEGTIVAAVGVAEDVTGACEPW